MKIFASPLFGLLLISVSAWAQETKQPATPMKSAAQVVVNGSQTDLEASRDFVAGKLIIGRKQIADSGVQNVSEILKREPAISVGKGGQLGLLGLPGYTQILLDGQPPMGKSPLELDLSQVDKIEIIKSSTAQTGPFGIAGTINIISRKIERKNLQQINAGLSTMGGEYGANGAWSLNQISPDSPFSFNLHASARRNHTPSNQRYEQVLLGTSPQTQYQGRSENLRTMETLSFSSGVNYQFDASNRLSIKPSAGQVSFAHSKNALRDWHSGRSLHAQQNSNSTYTGYDIPLGWTHDAVEYGQFEANFHLGRAQTKIDNTRDDLDSMLGKSVRQQVNRDEHANHLLILEYKINLSGGHDIKTGVHLTRNRQDMTRTDWLNAVPDTSLSQFAGHSRIWQKKRRLFAQDDWRVSKTLAVNTGFSVEDSLQEMHEAQQTYQTRYRVFSPSVHIAQKFDGDQKRRVRASLAQNFLAPETTQLMLRPTINAFAPCTLALGCAKNTIDTADTTGNPALRPERALTLNLAYEHGLSSESQVTLEFYARQIERKIGREIVLTNVAWANAPRYVERPANLGQAQVQGINLEWRIAARDVWKSSPKLDLRGSLGWAQSRINDLPEPDNRLEGSLPWRAKLGMTYAMASFPLKLDVDANWLPGDWLRNNQTQRTYESRRTALSANANWAINPKLRVIMNLDNLFAPEGETINEYRSTDHALQTRSLSASYTRVGVRMELKL